MFHQEDLNIHRLWGLFAINGNNSSGLLYLLGRRKYPIKDIDDLKRYL